MSKPEASSANNYHLSNETYKSPGGILLHSRTVVEKKDFVSTGILSYAEGDILEIEMSEYKAFELGDSVKLTVYSPGGIYGFLSTVVAKDHGALIIINPPQNQKRFAEKREHPRVDVKQKGTLLSFTRGAQGGAAASSGSPANVGLTVQNISISGLGFVVDDNVGLEQNMMLEAELDLGFPMPIKAEIVRLETTENGHYYGARYVDMAADKANSLRAFVLKKQVEVHFSKKRVDAVKRIFK